MDTVWVAVEHRTELSLVKLASLQILCITRGEDEPLARSFVRSYICICVNGPFDFSSPLALFHFNFGPCWCVLQIDLKMISLTRFVLSRSVCQIFSCFYAADAADAIYVLGFCLYSLNKIMCAGGSVSAREIPNNLSIKHSTYIQYIHCF